MAEPITFRDFAGAVMAGDFDNAAQVLATLLGVERDTAAAASRHFEQGIARQGQGFMMKAMSLRTAVTSGSHADIHALLGECFGLSEPTAASAASNLLQPTGPGAGGAPSSARG